jgi:hypothetical protein
MRLSPFREETTTRSGAVAAALADIYQPGLRVLLDTLAGMMSRTG